MLLIIWQEKASVFVLIRAGGSKLWTLEDISAWNMTILSHIPWCFVLLRLNVYSVKYNIGQEQTYLHGPFLSLFPFAAALWPDWLHLLQMALFSFFYLQFQKCLCSYCVVLKRHYLLESCSSRVTFNALSWNPSIFARTEELKHMLIFQDVISREFTEWDSRIAAEPNPLILLFSIFSS